MRLSSPMPRATSCTSAPTFSAKSAISLMKVILVARNALAAYLINSAVKRIGRVFDQLRGAPLGKHQRRLIERQRPVDIAEHLAPALIRGADHDAIRKLEVADRGTLAQEFRIGGHHHVGRRVDFMNCLLYTSDAAD